MKKTLSLLFLLCFIATHAQIPYYVPTNGLVGYWPFNGNTNDESGNGNNATSYNGASFVNDRFGNNNKAVSFDGIDDYLDVTINQSLSFTYSVWVKYNNFDNYYQSVFQHKNNCSRGGGYILAVSGDKLRLVIYNCGQCQLATCSSQIDLSNISTLNPNTWYNFIVTSNGSNSLKIYQNGTSIYELTSPNAFVDYGAQLFTIGKLHDSPDIYYTSAIKDDIGIWNRALTQEEITNLYYADSTCQSLVINTGLLSFNPPTYTNTVTIYPNPANDHITIDCGTLANVSGWNIVITNTLGKEVFNQPMNTQQYVVPLNTWSGQGVYFVKIYNAQGTLVNTKKIILQ